MAVDKLQELAEELHSVNAVKFGDFLTKSGVKTPVYFDLRVIVSYPSLMEKISNTLYEFAVKDSTCDQLCGVPYTALPIATLLSVRSGRPMLMWRKEAKGYGTNKMIEGHYSAGQTCLVIEDVVTSGSSVLDVVKHLRKEGLKASEAVVILNREQGGAAALQKSGVAMRALFTLTDLVARLAAAGKIEASMTTTVAEYLKSTQLQFIDSGVTSKPDRKQMSYESRAELAQNAVAKQLFTIMATKQTNLCVSVDLTTTAAVLDVVQKVGPHVCLIKTHIDVIEDFTLDFVAKLQELAKKHNFLIMEDRKYADIGHTVALQYANGVARVAEWADLVTAHSLPGEGMLKGFTAGAEGRPRGVFLVAEMSSANNLITPEYTAATLALASSHSQLVAGVVCQSGAGLDEPGLVQLTPGVQLNCVGDEQGQRYRTPRAVVSSGADVAVVGRGVTAGSSPQREAARYRDALWAAYRERVGAA